MEDHNSQLQTKPARASTSHKEGHKGFPDWLLWKMKGQIEDQAAASALDCSFVWSVSQNQKGRIEVPVGSTCGYDDSVGESDVVCTVTQGPSTNPQSVNSDITPFELQPEGSGVNYYIEIVSNDANYTFRPPDEWFIACRAATITST